MKKYMDTPHLSKHVPRKTKEMRMKKMIVFLYVTLDISVFMKSKLMNMFFDRKGTTKS